MNIVTTGRAGDLAADDHVTAAAAAAVTVDRAASRSSIRSGLVVAGATAIAAASNYASNVVLGRGLDPRRFAGAALVVSVVLLIAALSTAYQLTAARAVAVGSPTSVVDAIRRRSRRVALIVGGTFVIGAPLWELLFHLESVLPFVVLGLGVPVHFAMSVCRGVLQGTHRFARLGASMAAEAVVRLLVTVAGLVIGLGVTSAAAGLVASFLAGLVVARSVQVGHGPASVIDRPASYVGQAMVLLLIGQVVIANGDVIVVTAIAPKIAGLYAAIALVGRVVFVAGWSVVTVVFPALVAGGAAAQTAIVRRASIATAVIGGAMTVAAAITGSWVIGIVLGPGYQGAGGLLWPYALATTLFTLVNVRVVADVAAGSQRTPTLMVVGAIVQTGCVALAASSGAVAAVWVQVLVMGALLVAIQRPRGGSYCRRGRTAASLA